MITFDMVFNENRSTDNDNLFAEAIKNAGNVVLCESIIKEIVELPDKSGADVGDANIEKFVRPIPTLLHNHLLP